VSGLAHYFERQGIPAVAISLIREHSAKIKPPRALAVPFELGRPFGAPNAPDFQRKVLRTALELLERTDGPILADFPDQPPDAHDDDAEGWACPINLSSPAHGTEIDGLKAEIALLRPWYDEAGRNAQGRRLDGLTKLDPDALASFLLAFRDDANVSSILPATPTPRAVKLSADDLKHFYYQAAIARPGSAGRVSDVQLANWFFGETRMGDLFLQIRERYLKSENDVLQRLATLQLVPGHQGNRKPKG
jgi:hypothetical protein